MRGWRNKHKILVGIERNFIDVAQRLFVHLPQVFQQGAAAGDGRRSLINPKTFQIMHAKMFAESFLRNVLIKKPVFDGA